MDLNDLRSAVTAASFLLFLALMVWVCRPSRRPAFERAQQLPFEGEAEEGEAIFQRAERRAAPKPARLPTGDRAAYSSTEGQTS